MMNEELAGTIPATAGLTETETLGGVGAVGQVGTEEMDSLENAWTAPPAPLTAQPARPAEFDVTGWNLDRSELTTLKVRLGEKLNDDSLAFLQRSRMDGYLDVPGNEALVDELARQNSLSILEHAEERERKEAEVKRQHDEAVMDKFECLFDDGNDAENKRKAEELFGEGYWTPNDAMNQVAAVELVADGLYGEYGVKQSGEELRRNLGLPFDADAAVVYGVLKDRFARRKEAKIEHAKMQASVEALDEWFRKEVSLAGVDAARDAELSGLVKDKDQYERNEEYAAFANSLSFGASSRSREKSKQQKRIEQQSDEIQKKWKKIKDERLFSILDGTLEKKFRDRIAQSDLSTEQKYEIDARVPSILSDALRDELIPAFLDGQTPYDWEERMQGLPRTTREALTNRIKSEWKRFVDANNTIDRLVKEDEEKRRIQQAQIEKERKDFKPSMGKWFPESQQQVDDGKIWDPDELWEMKDRVRMAYQLNKTAVTLSQYDSVVQKSYFWRLALSEKRLNYNKFLSEDQGMVHRGFAQVAEGVFELSTYLLQGAGSIVNLAVDTIPSHFMGNELTQEQKQIRQRLFDVIRTSQTKPGSLAWGSETMGGKLRQGIVQAAGSTLTFASTYGIGTVLSVWDDEANRLMAEGAGFWSAHARGLAAGGVEYATENLGGLTMGSFKAAKFGARVGSRAAGAAVRPLTKWGKMQRFIEAPLIAKAAAVKGLFTPAEGMLTKAAGYMAAGRVAWRQKKYGSAALRTGAAWAENTLEEAFEEVVGDVAGVPLDRMLARLFGDPLETIASDDGTVRPWYAETARRAWGTFTDPGLWAGVVVLGAAGAGLNVGRYTREAAISSMDAEHIRAAVGCTWREALRIARIKDPAKRLPEIGKMAVTVKTEYDAGKRTLESVHGNMVEGLRAWALADDGLRSLDIYDDLVAQGKLPEFKKLGKNRYLVKMRDKEGKITSSEISETALVKHLGNQMMAGVAAEIATSVEAGAKNAMIGELRKDPRFVVQEGDAGAHYDELVRRYNAAKKLIEMGRSLDEVVPEVDADRALGDVLAESPEGYKERAWLEWQRDTHLDPREANDKEAFEASFAKGQFDAPAMNSTLRYGTRAGKVFLRFVKGKAGMKEVLEELVEAGFKSGRFDYVQQGELLRALQEQTGLQGQFMTQEGEFGVGNVIEGISKLALSDVMANPDFYAMPTWMKDAVRTLRQFNMDALDLCKLGAKVAEMHEEGLLPGSLMENVHALMGDAVGYFKGVAHVAQSSAMQQAAVAAVTAADAPALAEAGLQDVSGMRDDVAEELTVPSEPVSVAEVMEKLRALEGTELVNDESGMTAVVNRQQAKKMCSPAARHKSQQNGLSANEHLQAVARVAALFRHAVHLGVFDDVKNGEEQVKIHRLAAPVFIRGKMMSAKLTVKESRDKNARRIYSLELMEIEALGGSLRSVSPEGTDSATPSAGNILARFREIVKGNVKGAEYADNAVTAPAPVEQDAEDLNDLMEEAMTGKTREERDREAADATMAALEGGEKPDSGRVPVDKLELPQKRPAKRKRAEGDILFGSRAEAAPVQVWVRKDGRLEVIGELHRQEDETVPCEFHYEADGFDEAAGLLLDAEMNIRYGIGSAIDFARYCRETGVTKADALARGWFGKRQGDGVRIGIYGSESLYQAFLDGKIGERQAAKIAQAAPGNDALQRMGVREVVDRKKTADYAVAVMQAAVAQENGAPIEADAAALNEARKMAEYATRMKKALRKMIDSAKGAINDPENFAAVTKSKVKDTEGAMLTLANLTAALKRWENFAVHPELAAEARAWDGKSRVTVEADALPPAIEPPAYAMNINPETAETLESLQEMAEGKDIVIHNAEHGDFAFEWGRIGREKDGKGGMGLEHIFHKRLQHGFTLEETARIAVLASMAAQEGSLTAQKGNRRLFDLNGVRAVVVFDPDSHKTVITGFVLTEGTQPKVAVDAEAALRSQQFYALDELSRVQQVGAAMKEAIAWYEDIVKMYPQDYDKVLSGYVAWLKRKQEAKVRGEAVPPEMEAPSYAMNITPETAETLESLQEMAEGKDIVIHNAEHGDFAFEWGRIGREKDGKGGMGLEHIFHKRLQHGFTLEETARIAVLASMAAQNGKEQEPYRNVHRFDLNGVRAAVAFNAKDSRKIITGFVVTNEKNVKGAVDADAAKTSRQFYASEALNRRQLMGAALNDAIAWYEDIVKMYPQDYDKALSGYVAWLKRKQEAKVRGEAVPPEMEAPSYSIHLTSADVCRTRQEARAKVGRKGKPIPLENTYLQLEAEFSAKSERKFSHDDSIGRTFAALKDSGLSDEEIKTAHYSAYGNIVKLFANGERMEFERAYKKKEERKGFLHVYSPFEMEGSDRQYEADIELMIYRQGGQKPSAYLLNVSIQEKPRAIETGVAPKEPTHLAVPAAEVIQSDFPEIVKPQAQEPGYSMRWLGGKQVREALAPERGNLAMSWLIDDMVKAVNKVGELGNILHLSEDNDREKYINAVHDVTGKFLALRMALPEKWRPSIDRDLKYLRKYMELAMRGEVDLTAESDWDTWKIIQNEFGRDAKDTEELLKELGRDKAHKQVEKILGRIKNKMEKWGKWQIRQQAERLFRMAKPQVDLVTKKQKRGLMDAASVYRVKTIQELWGMSAGTWKSIMKEMADSMHDNDEASSEWLLLQTFGSFERMTLNDAVRALEELKKFVRTARTEWDEKLDAKRGDLARLSDEIIETVGRPTAAEIHENNKKPKAWKRVKGIPADLQNIAQAYAHMRAVGLGVWGDNLQRRMINASRWIQQARDERMAEMDAHVRRLGFKSWGKFVKWMHESGEIKGLHAVASPVLRRREVSHANAYRMRGLSGAELKQALADADLNEDDWKELLVLMQSRDEMVAVYERNLKHWEAQDKASKQGTTKPSEPKELKDKSFVILRDVGEVEESIPRLTHGQALYIILMSEQPRYYQTRTDKDGNVISEGTLPAHGWDDANIKALKDYVEENGLEMGYIMRRLLQEQGEILREVYEDEYGVPFPQEENYFPARFLHPEGGETTRDKIMREYMGLTPNSTSWQKMRVDHKRAVDTNTDALSVFVKTSMMVDNWLHTHTITQDIDAVLKAEGAGDAIKNAIGPQDYRRFVDFSQILKNAIVLDLSGTASVESWVKRGLSSYARATLSYRIETLLRQMPAIMNGYIGSDGSVTLHEYLQTMWHLKKGKARMGYRKMLASAAMQERMRWDYGNMVRQALNEEDMPTVADTLVDWGMKGMEKTDAWATAFSMVPVWNIYFERAKTDGMSDEEAEAQAWAAVDDALARGAQPNGVFHKSLFAGSDNAFVRSLGYMLSEEWCKTGQIVSLWKSGARMKAFNSWMIYGGFNALMMYLLDLLRYDDDEKEKRHWWDYFVSALYGPLAGVPVIGQMAAGCVNYLVNSLGGNLHTGAGGAQAVINTDRFLKDVGRFFTMASNDKHYDFRDWTYATGNLFKGIGAGTFAATNWRGSSWFILAAALVNPVKTIANAKHAWFD